MGYLWEDTVRFTRVSFSSSTQNDKFDWQWNRRDSWNYFYFQTFYDSGKDCNFQAFCDSAILARRGNKQKVRHFRRFFDIVYGTEHHPFSVTYRTNEFTVRSACQTNQRVQQPNLRVHPRPDTRYLLHQCIHKSRSPTRKTSTPTILKIGSNICWFAIEDMQASRVLLYRNFRSSIHGSTIMLRVCLKFCSFYLADIELTVYQNAHVNRRRYTHI